MLLKIRPQVGDLVRVVDPYFDDDACGYCVESEESHFTLRYFDDETKQYDFDYWYDGEYDLEMSIISLGWQNPNDFAELDKLNDYRQLQKPNQISRLENLNEINKLQATEKHEWFQPLTTLLLSSHPLNDIGDLQLQVRTGWISVKFVASYRNHWAFALCKYRAKNLSTHKSSHIFFSLMISIGYKVDTFGVYLSNVNHSRATMGVQWFQAVRNYA